MRAGGSPSEPRERHVDEEELRRLWEITIPGAGDLAGLDPGASYRPRPPAGEEGPRDEESSAGPLVLPLWSVQARQDAASHAATRSDEGYVTTIAESGPGSGGTTPTPGPQAAVVKDGAGRTWLTPSPGGVATDPSRAETGFLYQLREVVGKGGMGVVYRARQSSLQRDVAVKKILAERAAPELQRRFLAEALVTGRLDHPNVVPVYDLGVTPEGETVLAMKLVEGTSWRRLLRPRTEEERARAAGHDLTWHLGVLRSVGNAVAFAHSRHLVHLDLKPENVMVGEFGEVLVMDWGLAVEVTPQPVPGSPIPHRTQIKAPCGTPSYMPPELAEGRGAEVGPWSDVFLMGAILLELITGRPPNRGSTFRETVLMALRCAPPDLPPDVPADLAAICLKALARDPRERFQSVPELQLALDEHLSHRESLKVSQRAGERLIACQRAAGKLLQRLHGPMPAAPEELERERSRLYAEYAESSGGFAQARLLWAGNEEARRGEQIARLAFAEAALLQGDLGLAEAQLAQADPEGRAVETLRQRVEEARATQARAARQARLLRGALAAALTAIVGGLSLGIVLVRREREQALLNAAEARLQADEARRQREGADRERVRAEQREAESLLQQAELLGKTGRWGEARSRLDQGRELLRRLGLSLLPAELQEWELDRAAAAPLLRLPHTGAVTAAAFLPGTGSRLLLADRTGEVRLWDALTGLQLAAWRAGAVQRALLVLPGGRQAVGAGDDGALRVWELPEGRELRVLRGHQGPVRSLAATPDGARLMSGGEDGTVRTWLVADGSALSSERAHEGAVTGLAIYLHRFGPLAVSVGRDGKILEWHVESGRCRDTLRGEGEPLSCVTLAAHQFPGLTSDLVIAIGTEAHELLVWTHRIEVQERGGRRHEFPRWGEQARLRLHRAPLTAAAADPAGRLVVTAALDGRVAVVDLAELRVVRSGSAGGPLLALALAPRGALVAAGGEEGAGSTWDLGLSVGLSSGGEVEREARPLEVPGELVPVSAALSPDGTLAAAGTAQGPLLVWHVASGQLLAELVGHRARVGELRFLDGARLVSAAEDGRVLTHDLAGAQPDVPVSTAEAAARGAVALSPRGDALAVVVPERGVLLFGLPEGALRRELPLPDARAAAFSPRGGLLVVGRAGGEVGLFEAGSGREARAFLPAHAGPISWVALSSDGTRALSGGGDGLVRAWEVAEGRRMHDLRGHAGLVQQVGFAAGGVGWSAGADGAWRLWTVERGLELHSFAGAGEGAGALALDPEVRRALSVAGRRVVLWDFTRPAASRSLQPAFQRELDQARVGEARQLGAPGSSALAAWLSFRGAQRAALEAVARGGELPALRRLVIAWELGRPAVALRALEDAVRAGEEPAATLALCRARLLALAAQRGDVLGRMEGLVRAVVPSPDGARVACAGSTGEVLVWELQSGRLLLDLRGGVEPHGLCWTRDGAWLVSGDRSGALTVWDASSGELLATRPALEREGIRALAPLAARRVLVGGEAGTIGEVDLGAEAPVLQAWRREGRAVEALAVAVEGRSAASAQDGQVTLWEVDTGSARELPGGEGDVGGLVFAPDGRLLVARGPAIEVWGPEREAPDPVLRGHERAVVSLALARDGTLASTDIEGHVVAWDLARGQPRREASAPGLILTLGITPDGGQVITGARDGALTVWQMR